MRCSVIVAGGKLGLPSASDSFRQQLTRLGQPCLLLPKLGHYQSSLASGSLNVVIGS